MDINTLKENHSPLLDKLLKFSSICRESGLIYWLDSSSILNIFVDGEFKPTDDDILSISMPIEDFLKFRDRGLYIENIEITPMFTVLDSKYIYIYHSELLKIMDDFRDRDAIVDNLSSSIHELHQSWDRDNLKVIYGRGSNNSYVKFDISTIFPIKSISFGGDSISVPNNIHSYISQKMRKQT